jgi:DNA-binding IclR family transcriptional regulator
MPPGCGSDDGVAGNTDPNNRPLNVVTFLAAHPAETFTLAEICRHLELSKGSAHRVMTALTETGFVHRHPRHKTYSLGIALVAIGQAALERYPGIGYARREMARMVAELGVACGLTAISNNEYVLLAREGAPHSYDGLTLVGERRFVVPTNGIGQMAWRNEREIADYLDSGAGYLTDKVRNHLLASFPAIRRRGYSMAANGLGMRRLMLATVVPIGRENDPSGVLEKLAGAGDIPLEEFQMIAFADHAGKGVNYIAAPIFGPDSEISMEILISNLPVGMSEAEFDRYAGRLLLAADIVTNEIRGRKPQPW